MNKVELVGNLATDPEVTTTANGISKCAFRLAVQRRFTNQGGVRETDFLPVVCWRQLADFCGKYLTKGRKCAVVGSIQVRQYQAQDGAKRYVTEIVADEVDFLDKPKSDAAQNGATADTDGFTEVNDDELPF